jgi:hypothetical protein
MDEQASIKEAKRLASGAFGLELANAASSYAAPIFWVRSQASDGTEVNTSNGTAFFVDFGRIICGVTAGHVYDAFREEPGISSGCRIGPSTVLFNLRDRKISRGRNIDICTFDVSRSEAESTKARIISPSAWPPSAPEIGQAILFAGFPGHEKRVNRLFNLEFGRFSGAGMIESVRDLDFSCQVDRKHMAPLAGRPLPEPGYDFGGVSGAPVFRVHRGDIVHWELLGIVYQCGQTLVELIKMARADLICEDGVVAA